MRDYKKTLLIAMLCVSGGTAVTAQQNNNQTTAPRVEFKLNTQGEPQGTTLDAQIARGEFYKAQYAHDPATQAKYQAAIDKLKADKAEIAKKAAAVKDEEK